MPDPPRTGLSISKDRETVTQITRAGCVCCLPLVYRLLGLCPLVGYDDTVKNEGMAFVVRTLYVGFMECRCGDSCKNTDVLCVN